MKLSKSDHSWDGTDAAYCDGAERVHSKSIGRFPISEWMEESGK